MSAKHAHDLISAAEVFKIQGGVFLPYLNIGFSNWCNTQYGCADLFAHLTAMCRCGASAEGQYRESRKDPKAHCLPSGRWTLGMIRSIPPDQMLVRCTNMIRFTVRRMKKHGMLDGNLHISIDKHLMPRYDENPDMTNLVKSKHNDGTCTFDCLAVVQGVVDGARAVLGVLRVTRGDLKVELVSRLLDSCRRNGIPLRLLKAKPLWFRPLCFSENDGSVLLHLAPTPDGAGLTKGRKQDTCGSESWQIHRAVVCPPEPPVPDAGLRDSHKLSVWKRSVSPKTDRPPCNCSPHIIRQTINVSSIGRRLDAKLREQMKICVNSMCV